MSQAMKLEAMGRSPVPGTIDLLPAAEAVRGNCLAIVINDADLTDRGGIVSSGAGLG